MNSTFENETFLDVTIGIIFNFLYFSGLILEILCAVLFIYHIFKKTKYFCTGFFCILTIGFGFDIASVALLILGFLTAGNSNHDMFLNIGYFLFWYSSMILGPWNTLMALNRFTAVWFWKRHDQIWNWKFLVGGILAMFFYPFIPSIHLLILNVHCYFYPVDEENCMEFTNTALFVGTISNGIHVIISVILGIATSCASRFGIISMTPETKKFEQFLLIQSILSLLLYFCHLSHILTTDGSDDTTFERIIANLSDTYYTFLRISSALLLFILSKTIRQSFVNFYIISLFRWCKKKANFNKQEGSKATTETRNSIPMLKVT